MNYNKSTWLDISIMSGTVLSPLHTSSHLNITTTALGECVSCLILRRGNWLRIVSGGGEFGTKRAYPKSYFLYHLELPTLLLMLWATPDPVSWISFLMLYYFSSLFLFCLSKSELDSVFARKGPTGYNGIAGVDIQIQWEYLKLFVVPTHI